MHLHSFHHSSAKLNRYLAKTSVVISFLILATSTFVHSAAGADANSSSKVRTTGNELTLNPTRQLSKCATQSGTSNNDNFRRYREKTCFAPRDTISCIATDCN